MSALRLSVARLAPLLALAALAPFAACTRATPGYCTGLPSKTDECGPGFTCRADIHTCEAAVDGAGGAGGAAVDAPVDTPTDVATGDTGTDSPAIDAPSSDASDAATDVFHGCVDNHGCNDPSKPVCQTDGGVCVGCLANGDCTTMGARACDTAQNKCVECVVNSDCTFPAAPICDNQHCRSCKVDSECTGTGPGVCMFHLDGHCASDAETVYVAPTGTYACSDTDPAAGTSTKPFCHSQPAIDSTAPAAAVDAGTGNSDGGNSDAGAAADGGGGPPAAKTLVVMRGPSMMSQWSFNDAARTLTVVGQLGATVSPGANTGIQVGGGTVYIRSVRVTGSQTTDPAILANGGELHLDRCTIDSNGGGGVQIDHAGYEITNSVIAANGVSTFATGPVLWSGVLLGMVPTGKPATFLNNTVVNNMEPGVICTTNNSHDIVGSILYNNAQTTGSPALGCNYVTCCTGDPMLTTTYRLMSTSPCKDQLAANMSTAYDIDGNPRPQGTLSDCGADEYVVP